MGTSPTEVRRRHHKPLPYAEFVGISPGIGTEIKSAEDVRLDALELSRLVSRDCAVRRCHAGPDVLDEEGEPPKMTRSILIVIAVGVFVSHRGPRLCAGRRWGSLHSRSGVRHLLPRFLDHGCHNGVAELPVPDAALPGEPLSGSRLLPVWADRGHGDCPAVFGRHHRQLLLRRHFSHRRPAHYLLHFVKSVPVHEHRCTLVYGRECASNMHDSGWRDGSEQRYGRSGGGVRDPGHGSAARNASPGVQCCLLLVPLSERPGADERWRCLLPMPRWIRLPATRDLHPWRRQRGPCRRLLHQGPYRLQHGHCYPDPLHGRHGRCKPVSISVIPGARAA